MSIHSLLAAAGASGKAIPETPTQIVAKLKTAADGAWLMAKADEVEALRLNGMPSEPRKPNPKDEQKDAAKYAKDLAKYEADQAKYKPAMDKFTASRDKLVDEVLEKAGAGARRRSKATHEDHRKAGGDASPPASLFTRSPRAGGGEGRGGHPAGTSTSAAFRSHANDEQRSSPPQYSGERAGRGLARPSSQVRGTGCEIPSP